MMVCRTWTAIVILFSLVLQQRCGGVQDDNGRQTSQGHDAIEVSPLASQEREKTPEMEMYSSAVYALERKYPNKQEVGTFTFKSSIMCKGAHLHNIPLWIVRRGFKLTNRLVE